MARNKQILIHYHTSTGNVETVKSEIRMGEIVVKHATDKPELYIKNDNNEIVTFIDSKAIENKLSVLKTDLEGQISAADNSAVSALTDFKTEVANTYATKTGVTADISAAKSEAITSAANYTDAQVEAAAGELSGEIAGVDGRVTTLNNSFTAYQGTVASTYATKTGVTADISAAKSEAITSAANYTDAQVEAAADELSGEITKVDNKVTALTQTVNTLSSDVNNKFNNYYTSAQTDNKIATAKSEAITSAAGYTDAQVAAAEGRVNNSINGLDSRIDTLEGLSATTQSAVQTITVNNSETHQITATKTGTSVAFNFDEMIIDCGEF